MNTIKPKVALKGSRNELIRMYTSCGEKHLLAFAVDLLSLQGCVHNPYNKMLKI